MGYRWDSERAQGLEVFEQRQIFVFRGVIFRESFDGGQFRPKARVRLGHVQDNMVWPLTDTRS